MPDDPTRVWRDSMPDAYERWLVPTVFRPFAVDLARRSSALAPKRILELAAGTGALTRELVAACPAAEVMATDLNDAMVELGRARASGAVWRQADAMNLGFDDAEFDLIVCQFGVMFFPDKPSAFAEARRVLAPGGRLLMNAWAGVRVHDFQAAVMVGLERAFPKDPPTFIVAVPHGYTDHALITADLEAGGFERVTIEDVTLEGHAASAADVAAGYCTGTPLRAQIEARGDPANAMAVVTSAIEERFGTGAVSGRMTAIVFEASRSA